MATTGVRLEPNARATSSARTWTIAWWQQVLLIALCSIFFIYATAFFGSQVLVSHSGWGEGVPAPLKAEAGNLPDLFVRWDGGYYLGIAEHGYRPGNDERAFFPLYPESVGLLSHLTGVPLLWMGMLVSAVAFILAGLYFYRWARIDYSHDQALLATLLMYVSPMAFFFVAFYGEPLLLLCSIATLYFVRRGQFTRGGIAIALAGAARGTAFLLAVPYVVEFWQRRDFSRQSWLRFVLGGVLAPMGIVIHAVSLYLTTGFWPTASADKWKTYYAWPGKVLYDGLKAAIFGVGINHDWFSRFLAWHDLLYALAGLAIGVWALRHLRASASLFLFVGVLFLCSVHGPYGYAFWSIARRLAVLVPVYVAVVLLLDRLPGSWRRVAVTLSVISLGILSAWFASGRWIA